MAQIPEELKKDTKYMYLDKRRKALFEDLNSVLTLDQRHLLNKWLEAEDDLDYYLKRTYY